DGIRCFHVTGVQTCALPIYIEGGVNTQYPDYSSIVSFDGSALYFTSRRPWENNKSEKLRNPKDYTYMEDVYVSYLGDDDVWSTRSEERRVGKECRSRSRT